MAGAEMRDKYTERVHSLYSNKHKNAILMSDNKYKTLLQELQKIATSGPTESKHYQQRKKFDIMTIGNEQKVVKKGTQIILVSIEESFDILQDVHLATGHGGRNTMRKALCEKYANITVELIMIYLNLCKTCQLKKSNVRKDVVVRPIISNDWNSRCQVDLIDMQSRPDKDFKYILVYQDHHTKFCSLRALHTMTATEVAYHLIGIFCERGAPVIIQSGNGREFANKVAKEVVRMWPECKLVHGKPPRHSQSSQGSVERCKRDIEAKLACWMQDNCTDKWSDGLRFVQLSKNSCYHSGIGQTPFEATYGTKPKLGLSCLNIPRAVMVALDCEEDVEKLFCSNVANSSSEEN